MTATVHMLHSQPLPIGSFLRVGHTGHRKLETLIAASRIRFRRFVFDAAHINDQSDLLGTLQRAGCEIVLDPNAAETATPGRFDSAVSSLPWGNSDRPWHPTDFSKTRNLDTAKAIAEFAVRHKVDAVLAPSHCIDNIPSPWLSIDLSLCEELRNELDRAGGKDIENRNRHFVIQKSKQIKNLSLVPETRAEHFLLHHLDPAVWSARIASRLKFSDENVAKLFEETKKRLTNLRDPLGDLHSTSVSASRSAAPKFRGNDRSSQSAVG